MSRKGKLFITRIPVGGKKQKKSGSSEKFKISLTDD